MNETKTNFCDFLIACKAIILLNLRKLQIAYYFSKRVLFLYCHKTIQKNLKCHQYYKLCNYGIFILKIDFVLQ